MSKPKPPPPPKPAARASSAGPAEHQQHVGIDDTIAQSDATPAILQLFLYAKAGHHEDVAGLLSAESLDVCVTDVTGNTCLHYAAQG